MNTFFLVYLNAAKIISEDGGVVPVGFIKPAGNLLVVVVAAAYISAIFWPFFQHFDYANFSHP